MGGDQRLYVREVDTGLEFLAGKWGTTSYHALENKIRQNNASSELGNLRGIRGEQTENKNYRTRSPPTRRIFKIGAKGYKSPAGCPQVQRGEGSAQGKKPGSGVEKEQVTVALSKQSGKEAS